MKQPFFFRGMVCCFTWLMINAQPALASLVAFDFSGRITSVEMVDVGAVANTSSNDTFSGSFGFDLSTPLTRLVEPGRASYRGGGYISVEVNGTHYYAASGVSLQVFNDYVDGSGRIYDDFFMSMRMYEDDGSYWLIQMDMRDFSATTLNSLSLPSSDQILTLMDISSPRFFLRRFYSLNDEAWFARGAVTDYNVSAVPVPAAIWLFSSGLLGLIGLATAKRKMKI